MTISAQKLEAMFFAKRSIKVSFPVLSTQSWRPLGTSPRALLVSFGTQAGAARAERVEMPLRPLRRGHPAPPDRRASFPFGVTLLREDMRWQQHFSYGAASAGPGSAAGAAGLPGAPAVPRTAPRLPAARPPARPPAAPPGHSIEQPAERPGDALPGDAPLLATRLGCPSGWGQACVSPRHHPGRTAQHAALAHQDTINLIDLHLVFIFSRKTMYGFNKKAVKRYCVGNYHCV